MDVLTIVLGAAWLLTTVQLFFVAQARAKLVERMVRYGVKAEPFSRGWKLSFGMSMTLAVAAWIVIAIDSRSAHAQYAELLNKVDEANELNAKAARCDEDLHKAAIAVDAVKRKIDHQSRRDTIAITAEYHLDYTFDIGGDTEDMRFHTFCADHVNDALWFSDRDALAGRDERAKLMGYNGSPNEKGGFVMECRWSVIANRTDWCRSVYAP